MSSKRNLHLFRKKNKQFPKEGFRKKDTRFPDLFRKNKGLLLS